MLDFNINIAFDIDGVLRNLMYKLDEVYLQKYPEHADKLNPHVSWDLTSRYMIGKDIYKFLLEEHHHRIFNDSPAFPGAVECFNKCRRITTTGIITSQTVVTVLPTMSWLAWNGIAPDFIHVIYTEQAKHLGKRNFTMKSNVVDVDLLIDDHTVNLREWRDSGRRCVCINRDYNQDWDGKRVYDYDELYDYVINLLNRMSNP